MSQYQELQDMKRAAFILLAVVVTTSPSAAAPAETCRFIEPRAEREACYQRQEAARLERQKANEVRQQAEQAKPYEPMSADDAQLAKAIRGICRGC